MRKRITLLILAASLALAVIGCDLSSCGLTSGGSGPSGPPPTEAVVPAGVECDPRATPIDANRAYNESMHSTTEPYPANCKYYCVGVPDGRRELTIRVYDFDVDLDLYVGYGDFSSVSGSDITEGETYDWMSNEFGTADEQVKITNPQGGAYYIEICSYEGEASPFGLEATVR